MSQYLITWDDEDGEYELVYTSLEDSLDLYYSLLPEDNGDVCKLYDDGWRSIL